MVRDIRKGSVVQVMGVHPEGSWIRIQPEHERWVQVALDPTVAKPSQLGLLNNATIARPNELIVAPAGPKWAEV